MWEIIKEAVDNSVNETYYHEAAALLSEANFQLIWQSRDLLHFEYDKDGEVQQLTVSLDLVNKLEEYKIEQRVLLLAAYMYILDELPQIESIGEGRKYTRQGMIARVIDERAKRASELEYKVKLSPNLYGEHTLKKRDGTQLMVTIYDLDKQIGYIDNMDWKTNKLCTTKHIIFLCHHILNRKRKLKPIKPFIEITLDPLHNYDLTWIYNDFCKITKKELQQIQSLFGKNKTHLKLEEVGDRLKILNELSYNPRYKVRPELFERLSNYYDDLHVRAREIPMELLDWGSIKAQLYPYQKEGVHFCLFKKGAILADEMGLGKTIQAIAVALQKRHFYGFRKTLVICPASVKYQWASEINKFTDEKAIVISGNVQERALLYEDEEAFFTIANYESILRDRVIVDKQKYDFIILDEAQRIKNYNTQTAACLQSIHKEHCLVITGTPIENKLLDIYSIMLFIDKYALTPLWEFSYQHCVFDINSKNKINGYYNLGNLKMQLSEVILRREKRQVIDDLPALSEKNIMLLLHPEQASIHQEFMANLSRILAKKYKTPYDWDRIMILLTNMRRVSNSTFLIDKKSNHSSKLVELEDLLMEELDLLNNKKKIIIFSEWLDSHFLIGELLTKLGIGYSKLTGAVPTPKRKNLIEAFEKNDDCQVFLSTEAGGSGLNLQMADTVINFEIPWNPAKKNQRIGRIDRIGQKHKHLSVYNLICEKSIEMHIAGGLMLKQNLFDSVLNEGNDVEEVDFSKKGRAQFIQQLEEFIESSQREAVADIERASTTSVKQHIHEDSGIEVFMEEEVNENSIIESTASDVRNEQDVDKMQEVLNKGMQFLSGLYEMSTGQPLGGKEGAKIEIDKQSGEVVMRFKL